MNARSRLLRGFTLLETLVAISILGGLLFVATSLVRDIGDSRRRTQDRMRSVEGATLALDALASRLAVATVSDASGGSGILGDSTSLRVTGSGVSVRRLAAGADLSPLVDRATIELRIEGDGLVIDEDGADRSTLVPGLSVVRFRYHDGSGWRDEWDSAVDGLPVAVEARLWFDPWTDGRYPDWMPSPDTGDESETDFDDPGDRGDFGDLGDFGEFGDLDDFGDFTRSRPNVVSMEDGPAPDRVRIIALLDPVPLGGERVAGDEASRTEVLR